jgi:hypothetical protein
LRKNRTETLSSRNKQVCRRTHTSHAFFHFKQTCVTSYNIPHNAPGLHAMRVNKDDDECSVDARAPRARATAACAARARAAAADAQNTQPPRARARNTDDD